MPFTAVTSFQIVGPYTLDIRFDDATEQRADFEPILTGELYKPLRDIELFNQARIDEEVHTLAWPNGADFDPATLHDCPEQIDDLKTISQPWETASAYKER